MVICVLHIVSHPRLVDEPKNRERQWSCDDSESSLLHTLDRVISTDALVDSAVLSPQHLGGNGASDCGCDGDGSIGVSYVERVLDFMSLSLS